MPQINIERRYPAKLQPIATGAARYKGIHGGRGSGKSHFFAEEVVLKHLDQPGRRTVCIREVQKTLKESAKRLIEDKIQQWGVGGAFDVTQTEIRTRDGGLITFQGMQDQNAESIKSLEGYSCAWVEEAQTLSSRSLELLRPTIRAPGSELWFSWNPRRPDDPVDKLLRGAKTPTDAIVTQLNWDENPFFPDVLEKERKDCQANDPDRYGHIWEGEYQRIYEGAYYAGPLEQAEREDRIGIVQRDPLQLTQAFWDIGGTSGKSDATSIWIAQFIGTECRVLDYYEAVGQEFTEHVYWLRSNGYDKAKMILPHDGRKHDIVHQATPEGFLRQAGFHVQTVPNVGAGAAMKRIEAARRAFPFMRFDVTKTEAGRDALAYYHERRDEVRNVGLGPEHDWSSHAADAFGLMAMQFLGADPARKKRKPLRRTVPGLA